MKRFKTRYGNFHDHLREGNMLPPLVALAMQRSEFSFAMGNTKEGILDGPSAIQYKKTVERNAGEIDRASKFTVFPIMMGNEQTTSTTIRGAHALGVRGVKFMPKNRTTNAHYGVSRYSGIEPALGIMEELGMCAHFHPEHPDMRVSNEEAEYRFLGIFEGIQERFPKLRKVWEHCTDSRVLPFLRDMENVALGITSHHLHSNGTQVFGKLASGVCKPPFKQEIDRAALVEYVLRNHPRTIHTPDTAAHLWQGAKILEPDKVCCGVYSAPYGPLLCVTALNFDDRLTEEVLNNFLWKNGCRFHNVPEPTQDLVIVEGEFRIPLEYPMCDDAVVPFLPGQTLPYTFEDLLRVA